MSLWEKTEQLRAMHEPGRPLVLMSAWDAASARLTVRAGAPAVATSCTAAAYAAGFPRADAISRSDALAATRTIARAVDVPVTADVQDGFGDNADEAARTAEGVIEAGSAGLDLHDGAPGRFMLSVEEVQAKIAAVRRVADKAGTPLVVNACTNVFVDEIGPAEIQLEHAIERGRAYLSAGADCVSVPGVTDAATIALLVERIRGPVGVLATPESPVIAHLIRLGVARISFGSATYRAALSASTRIADEVYAMGTLSRLAVECELTDVALERLMR